MAGASSSADVEAKAAVFVEVEKLELYTERYDRAYRDSWWRRGPSPWRGNWGPRAEVNLINARRRDQHESGEGPSALVRHLEEQKLRDGFLVDIDRPGPLPNVTEGIHRFIPLPRFHRFLRGRSGSMLTLPLRVRAKGHSASWEEARDQALDHFAATRPGLPSPRFRGPRHRRAGRRGAR